MLFIHNLHLRLTTSLQVCQSVFYFQFLKHFFIPIRKKSSKEKKKQWAATGTLKIYKAWVRRRVRERASVQIIEWRPLCWPQKGSSLPFLLIHHSGTKSIFYHLHCVASSSPSRASSEVERRSRGRNGNEKTGYEWGVWAIGQIGRWGNLIVSMDGYARTHVIMDLRDLLFDHKNGILE